MQENFSKNSAGPANIVALSLITDKQWHYIQKLYHMTPKELLVARLVCQGVSNDEIAETLDMRAGTVKTHLRNIYRRVRVKNKISLLLQFVQDAIKHSPVVAKPEASLRVQEYAQISDKDGDKVSIEL